MSITDVEHVDTHGGSIRVYIQRSGAVTKSSVLTFLTSEKDFGLTDYSTYIKFANDIQQLKINVDKNIKALKHRGFFLVGYGAPAKATTSLNYFGITKEEINYIVEDNSLKHGKYVPGVGIPIYSRDKFKDKLPDVVIVMAWNFFEEIKQQNQDLIEQGVIFISIKDLMVERISLI
jgi:hypothetical protein